MPSHGVHLVLFSFPAPLRSSAYSAVCLSALIALTLSLLTGQLCGEEPAKDKPRRFADGPLTPDDFKMAAPNPAPNDAGIPMVAMTYAELRYSFHYRWEDKNGRATAWPADVDLFAALDRARSWNTQPQSARILDHEQGHFDIAEIQARLGVEKLNKALAERKYIGRGKTEVEARADLEKQLKKEFDALVAQLLTAQTDYDHATQHGLATAAQAEARKAQKEQLEETLNAKRKMQNDKKAGP